MKKTIATLLLFVSSMAMASSPLDSSGDQTPYQTLQNLFNSATAPAKVSDFSAYPGTDKWLCYSAAEADAPDANLQQVYIGTVTGPSAGPLFPARTLLDITQGYYETTADFDNANDFMKLSSTDLSLVVDAELSNEIIYLRESGDYITGFVDAGDSNSYFYCSAPQAAQ